MSPRNAVQTFSQGAMAIKQKVPPQHEGALLSIEGDRALGMLPGESVEFPLLETSQTPMCSSVICCR